MKKLAATIVCGVLNVAYGVLFLYLMARMIDHGGWWIPVGVTAFLVNMSVLRYWTNRTVSPVGGERPDPGWEDGG